MEIELPDGTILDAPDDADPSVVAKAYLSKQRGPSIPDQFAGDPALSWDAINNVNPSPQPSATRGIRKFLEQLSGANDQVIAAPNMGIGSLEALGSLATGGLSTVAGSLAGMGTEAARGLGLTDAKGEDIAERVQKATTYSPRSESGRAQLDYFGALASPLTESGADVALMPLAPELQGLSTVRRAPKVKPDPIPTTADLKKAKTAAYAAAKEVDVNVPAETFAQTLGNVRTMIAEEGLDPTLHPKSTAVMRRLDAADGKPLSLQEAETLRKIALDAEDDLNPVTRAPTPDARIAGKIVDELDEQIEALSINSPARALNARFRRSDMIDRMIRRAEIKAGAHYTQAGMEHALRQEFKQLALNDRRMRFFTAEQRAAIEKVAKGGAIENALRNLGKFDPTTGGMAAFIGPGTGGAFGAAIGGTVGGGVGALALPALGFGAKRGATRLTGRNVDLAREALVGRGMPVAPTAEELGASLRESGMLRTGSGETLPLKFSGGAARSADVIRSDLQRLSSQLQSLPIDQMSPARIKAISEEVARLQAELASVESLAASPR